jgi:hypothetical protein
LKAVSECELLGVRVSPNPVLDGERYVHHEADVVGRVLRIFLQVVEGKLKACGPQAPTTARFGAVTLVHRCGAALHAGSGPGMAAL